MIDAPGRPWAGARRSDVVLRVPLVTGPLHGEVPVEVFHLALFLDEVLADAVQRYNERMPVLAIDLLLKRDFVPLQIAVLPFMTVLNGDGWQLQDLLQLLFGNVHSFLPIVHILVGEIDLAPGVLGLANRDLHHGSEGVARCFWGGRLPWRFL